MKNHTDSGHAAEMAISGESEPCLCPAEVTPAAPTTHNCHFNNDPASPLFYISLQIPNTKIPGMFGFGVTSLGLFFGVWAPFLSLLILLEGLVVESPPYKSCRISNSTWNSWTLRSHLQPCNNFNVLKYCHLHKDTS